MRLSAALPMRGMQAIQAHLLCGFPRLEYSILNRNAFASSRISVLQEVEMLLKTTSDTKRVAA